MLCRSRRRGDQDRAAGGRPHPLRHAKASTVCRPTSCSRTSASATSASTSVRPRGRRSLRDLGGTLRRRPRELPAGRDGTARARPRRRCGHATRGCLRLDHRATGRPDPGRGDGRTPRSSKPRPASSKAQGDARGGALANDPLSHADVYTARRGGRRRSSPHCSSASARGTVSSIDISMAETMLYVNEHLHDAAVGRRRRSAVDPQLPSRRLPRARRSPTASRS